MIKIFDKIVRRAYNISEARQYFISHAKNSVNCFFEKINAARKNLSNTPVFS